MSNISSISSTPSWEEIKETALKNQNLDADIRVSDQSVQVRAPGILEGCEVAMGLEKAPVYASKEETLTNLRDQLTLYFFRNLRTLIRESELEVGSKKYDELIKDAKKAFEDITKPLTTAITTTSTSTSQAIQEAHAGALHSLYLLREKFAKPQLTPQFCKMSDGKWSVLQPAPHPENLVLSGGGVKGAGYVGWFKMAEQEGILKNIKRLAGSSAGAMTAALVASGMSAEDLETAAQNINFESVLTGKSDDPIVIADTSLVQSELIPSFTGTYAVSRVNEEMKLSIKKYFESLEQGGVAKKIKDSNVQLTDQEQKDLLVLEKAILPQQASVLKNVLSFLGNKQKTHMITFHELALLAKLDARFKELTITGYNATQQKEIYYNVQNSPNMDIAEAVRTSISLPLVFQPIKDMVTKDVLEDGGVGSNVPAEVFRGQPQEKTLVLGFDNNGRFNDIVSRGKVHQTVGWLPILLSGNLNLQKTSDADAQKLYNAGPNAMDVTHGALNTTSFMASNATIDAAERQAEIRAMETFSLRQHQAVDHVFDSLQDAMKAMTTHELNDIINQYIFTEEGDPLAKKDRDDIRQAAEKELKTRNQPELQFEK